MGKVQDIQREIETLTPAELDTFRNWFYEHDAEAWDKKIEGDIRTGKLGKLAQDALEQHSAGKSKELRNISQLQASGSAIEPSLRQFANLPIRATNC